MEEFAVGYSHLFSSGVQRNDRHSIEGYGSVYPCISSEGNRAFSTASRWRMSTLCFRILRMPSESVVVATVGSPSGTAATAREIDILSICRKPYPLSRPIRKNNSAYSTADEHKLPAHCVKLALHRRLRWSGGPYEGLDMADFCVFSRGRNNSRALTAGDDRTHIYHVRTVAERNFFVRSRPIITGLSA